MLHGHLWMEIKQNYCLMNVINLKNPISSDLNTMRPSTIPNLLEAINQNKSRMFTSAKIFEVGPNFSKSLNDYQENVASSITYGLIDEKLVI